MILIEFNGKTACLAEHCRDIGIQVGTVRSRHSVTGETWQECLEHYLKFGKKETIKLIDFNGKIASLSEHCRDLDINVYTVQNRHYRTKDSYKECLEYYQKNGVKPRANYKIKNNRLYIKWSSIKDRCYNSKCKSYKNYGGRGIKVCERWQVYENFEKDLLESFLEHIEQYGYKDTTLDRIDVDGDYEPSNCRWATQKEQANNTTVNRMVTEDLNVMQFAEKYNLNYETVSARLKRGWSAEEISNPPIEKTKFYLPCEALKQHCIQNGYKYCTILSYIHKYNLEPHEALAKYLEKRLDKLNKV